MPHFDADQWSVLLITVIFGAARWTFAAFAVRPLDRSEAHHVRDAALCITKLPKAGHDADEWQAALMLVAEHEPQRPRPPDLYIRGRAGRSSADLSAQPERYHIKLHFRPARKVPRLRENFGCDFVGDRTDICNLASSATRRERRARSKRARPG